MRLISRIFIISLMVSASFVSYGHSADYKELIIGKWVIAERTSKMFDHSSSFEKAPWYVSYEFRKDGTFLLTVKEQTDEPHYYRVKGNVLHVKKYGVKGEYGIVELTSDMLTLKSPAYLSKFKREK